MILHTGAALEPEPNARAQVRLGLEPGLNLLHITPDRDACVSKRTVEYQPSFVQRFWGMKDSLDKIALL